MLAARGVSNFHVQVLLPEVTFFLCNVGRNEGQVCLWLETCHEYDLFTSFRLNVP